MDLIIKLLSYLEPYGTHSYIIMFSILIACGFGLPLPEDVILVSGGILAGRGIVDFWLTLAVCMAGVMIGDGIVFTIGRVMGPRIQENNLFRRMISEKRQAKVKEWFAKYGDKVIFLARFAPGLRMPMFLSAGIFHVAPWKFVMLDGFAAAISVPLWIWAGYLFGSNLEMLETQLKRLQVGLYSLLAIALLLGALFWWVKRKVSPRNS